MSLGTWPRGWRNASAAFLVIGVAWRVVRYLLQFPIWGDEAFVCLNFLDQDYAGLTKPLRFVQVAPLLFLWSELTAYRILGGSELAMRLLPFLAGLCSLFLFWRLVRLVASPVGGTIALGILAVAYYPVRHACEVKPYAFDLLMSIALMLAAVSWLQRPEQRRWLVVLTCLVPIALGFSYPSVFVTGAVTLALAPTVWRMPDKGVRAWFLAYNVLMALAFSGYYLLAGTGQYASTGGTENFYWTDWFPPSEPVAFLKWLVVSHTGNLFAYPVGGRNGGSALTFLLFVAGAWQFTRQRRWDILTLLLAPFGLTLLAAALHRYPYGGSARVAQHLAPSICLLAGVGAAALFEQAARWVGTQARWAAVACGLLALVAFAGMARDWRKPFKTDGDRQVRKIVLDLMANAGPDDQIVVLDASLRAGPTFEWHLRQHDDKVRWHGDVDWDRLAAHGQLWGLCFDRKGSGRDAVEARLVQSSRRMIAISREVYDLQLGQSDETMEHCEVIHWVGMYGE